MLKLLMKTAIFGVIAISMTACSGKNRMPSSLLDISTGPDASRIALGKNLQMPVNVSFLPAPDASAGNLSGADPVLVSEQATSGADTAQMTGSGSRGGFFSRLFDRWFN